MWLQSIRDKGEIIVCHCWVKFVSYCSSSIIILSCRVSIRIFDSVFSKEIYSLTYSYAMLLFYSSTILLFYSSTFVAKGGGEYLVRSIWIGLDHLVLRFLIFGALLIPTSRVAWLLLLRFNFFSFLFLHGLIFYYFIKESIRMSQLL